jgi:putative sterol carrier protein
LKKDKDNSPGFNLKESALTEKGGEFDMGAARNELEKIIPLFTDNPRAIEIMEGWPRTVLFDLDGEQGPFNISVKGAKMSLADGVPLDADIVVRGESRELADVVKREKDITHPIAEAILRVEKGKLSQLIIFDRILATARRKG